MHKFATNILFFHLTTGVIENTNKSTLTLVLIIVVYIVEMLSIHSFEARNRKALSRGTQEFCSGRNFQKFKLTASYGSVLCQHILLSEATPVSPQCHRREPPYLLTLLRGWYKGQEASIWCVCFTRLLPRDGSFLFQNRNRRDILNTAGQSNRT